ncbi:MAG: oligoendopeptidase F [Spirochaeta sp. LUC14_002_19_P3]|nr:MAG: oligoendopeptidase F [Spirochaeta sp. LUC14_002_19_P3]
MKKIPERKDVPSRDTWDLSTLFPNDEAWTAALSELEAAIPKALEFKGRLANSAACLAEALNYIHCTLGQLSERLGYYVMLRHSENLGDSAVQALHARYMRATAILESETSWLEPEIQAIDDTLMADFIKDDLLTDFRIYLSKLLRFKPHILSEKEEKLLAKQAEFSHLASSTFSALTNADMEFGTVKTADGEIPLTQSTYSSLLLNPDRTVREDAYRKLFGVFDTHKNTLSSLYAGSVLRDKYQAEIRGYPSARAMALFGDKVPLEVYDNLVSTVRASLPALHEYYRFRAARLGLSDGLGPWDTHVPLLENVTVRHTWDEAVTAVCASLAPLGEEYVSTLRRGLMGRWADRYENKGKRSGAFSAGSYLGAPYILMNYKEDNLRDVFTLAHEGGHSMHSWYSVGHNPFPHYNYTIFEAEVASTFNEQLLAHKLQRESTDNKLTAYLIGKQIDDVIATIYRQTMFAEFERDTHAMVEAGEPLTVDSLRGKYRELLKAYFGTAMNLEALSDLECLRIPHFYRAFYVYKYATGLSAAMALARRVLEGGKQEREDYLNFLKSGGSRFPLESLKLAGVDMAQPKPVEDALNQFQNLIKQLRDISESL